MRWVVDEMASGGRRFMHPRKSTATGVAAGLRLVFVARRTRWPISAHDSQCAVPIEGTLYELIKLLCIVEVQLASTHHLRYAARAERFRSPLRYAGRPDHPPISVPNDVVAVVPFAYLLQPASSRKALLSRHGI